MVLGGARLLMSKVPLHLEEAPGLGSRKPPVRILASRYGANGIDNLLDRIHFIVENPKPQTPNPKPRTLNPKLQILHPNP